MFFSQTELSTAGRPLTPAPFEIPAIDMVPTVSSAIAPVWTTREAATITQCVPEAALLDMYNSEDFLVEEQGLLEGDVDEQQYSSILLDRPSWHDSVMEDDNPVFVAEPVRDMQQVCRPYAAQAATLLFEVAMPMNTEEELALYNDLYPEVTPALFRPVEQVEEYLTTPELLDTSDLKLQPTLATGALRDPVSQMLDFDLYEVQETTFEDAPKRQGRSLVCPIPLYTVAGLDELQDVEVSGVDEQGEVPKREMTFFSSDNGPRDWEVEYDRVLRQITGSAFLPGLEHLTAIESRSAIITYDSYIKALQKANTDFLGDRHDGECFCLGDKVGDVVLPGENFLLADNDTGLGLSVQCHTAESLLSFIDTMVDDEVFVEDRVDQSNASQLTRGEVDQPTQHQVQPRVVVEPICPGALFDAVNSQYVGYTALDQLLGHSHGMSEAVCEQSVAASSVSDIGDEEFDCLSTPRHFDLTYFEADSQQFVGYTAFNQLLVAMDDDEVLPRIHREDDELDSDDVFLEGTLEINEVRQHYNIPEPQTSLPFPNEFEYFDFGFSSNQGLLGSTMPTTTSPRSVNSLRSYSSRRLSRRRPQLTVTTQLGDIVEVSSDEDPAQPSPSYSDASIKFAEHRGFVQALSVRRDDFLDDEDSDDGLVAPRSASASSSPGAISFSFPPVSPTAERIIVVEHFHNTIWTHEVDLYLAMPTTPVNPYSPSADHFPCSDILESLEAELYELIANLFNCLNARRFSEAKALGVDLQWALGAIVGVFPRLELLRRLGLAVEILLELVVASSN